MQCLHVTLRTMIGVVDVVDDRPAMSVDDGKHSSVDERSHMQRQVPAGIGHRLFGHIVAGHRAAERKTVHRRTGGYVRHAERGSGLEMDKWEDRTTGCGKQRNDTLRHSHAYYNSSRHRHLHYHHYHQTQGAYYTHIIIIIRLLNNIHNAVAQTEKRERWK